MSGAKSSEERLGGMRRFGAVLAVAGVGLGFGTECVATVLAQRPPELPKHVAATSAELRSYVGKRYRLTVESRQPQRNPATPEDLESLRKRAERLSAALPLAAASDGAPADLQIEYLYEPALRYGMFHSQNAPYHFLIARAVPDGRMLFCAFERESAISSASARLFVELRRALRGQSAVVAGDLAACARQAASATDPP